MFTESEPRFGRIINHIFQVIRRIKDSQLLRTGKIKNLFIFEKNVTGKLIIIRKLVTVYISREESTVYLSAKTDSLYFTPVRTENLSGKQIYLTCPQTQTYLTIDKLDR